MTDRHRQSSYGQCSGAAPRARLGACAIALALAAACGGKSSEPASESDKPAADDTDGGSPPQVVNPDAAATDAAPLPPVQNPPPVQTDASVEQPASQVDAGVTKGPTVPATPDASTIIANSDAGVVRASTDPLWVYMASPEGSLRNVTSPEQQIDGLSRTVEVGGKGITPWSKNGRWLANVTASGDEVAFYDLSTGEMESLVELSGELTLLDWAGNAGALVNVTSGANSSVLLVAVDGTSIPVYGPTDTEAISSYGVSPDGRSFVFSTSNMGDFLLYYVDLSDPQSPSAPTLVATYSGSPVIYLLWSPDSRWVAYGTPGSDDGVQLWSPSAGTDPTSANPSGAGFSPLYSFSPTSSNFVSHASTSDGSATLNVTPLGSTAGERVALDRGEGVSPAAWSPLGDYLTYSNATDGWLQGMNANGQPETRIPLPGWDYSCPLQWATATSFVYQTCTDATPKLRYADVDPSLVSTPLEKVDSNGFGAGGECLVLWDDLDVHAGVASDAPTLASAPFPSTPVERVFVHPEGKGVAWIVRRSLVYWMPLDGCAPAADPLLMSAPAAVQQLEFVPNSYLDE